MFKSELDHMTAEISPNLFDSDPMTRDRNVLLWPLWNNFEGRKRTEVRLRENFGPIYSASDPQTAGEKQPVSDSSAKSRESANRISRY